MGSFFVVLVFVGMAFASGAASTSVNGTLADGNADTMQLLMGSSSERMFTADSCVASVRKMSYRFTKYYTSFPPEDFVPPGAEEWCECLAADPSGITSLSFTYRGNDKSREPFEQAFDRCRASVLDGSDFNTDDICRGMFDLFGRGFGEQYVTFCGRICRRLVGDYVPQRDLYYTGVETSVSYGCGKTCSAETMPGYCGKYTVWYSAWRRYGFYDDDGKIERDIGIGDKVVTQQFQFTGSSANRRRTVAQELCNALHPLLGGNINECCNYARTFGALQECCALDSNGFAVFDCEKNFDFKSIQNACITRIADPYDYTTVYICQDSLLEEDFVNTEVWYRSDEGDFMFSFSDAALERICGEAICCNQAKDLDIVANCEDQSRLTYVGRTIETLDRPTPGAKEETEEGPCLGLCEDERECVLSGNGQAFCVDCTAFLKPKRSGDLAECCAYDAENRRCLAALKNSGPGICRRSEEIFALADDGSRKPVQFKRSSGFACGNPRDFRKNGAACKVKVSPSGKTRCVE